jgi:hypothetical protein
MDFKFIFSMLRIDNYFYDYENKTNSYRKKHLMIEPLKLSLAFPVFQLFFQGQPIHRRVLYYLYSTFPHSKNYYVLYSDVFKCLKM